MKTSIRLLTAAALMAAALTVFAAPKEDGPRKPQRGRDMAGGIWLMEAMHPTESAEVIKLRKELETKTSEFRKKVREERNAERRKVMELAKDPSKQEELKKFFGERYDDMVKKIEAYLKSNAAQPNKDRAKQFLDKLQQKGKDTFIEEQLSRVTRKGGRKQGKRPADTSRPAEAN